MSSSNGNSLPPPRPSISASTTAPGPPSGSNGQQDAGQGGRQGYQDGQELLPGPTGPRVPQPAPQIPPAPEQPPAVTSSGHSVPLSDPQGLVTDEIWRAVRHEVGQFFLALGSSNEVTAAQATVAHFEGEYIRNSNADWAQHPDHYLMWSAAVRAARCLLESKRRIQEQRLANDTW